MSDATQEQLEAFVRRYLEAFEARDPARCLEFFADDGAVRFIHRTFRGPGGIESWHRDRFSADLRVLQVDRIAATEKGAEADIVTTSRVLKSWGMPKLGARVKFALDGEKIRELSFQVLSAGGENYVWARK